MPEATQSALQIGKFHQTNAPKCCEMKKLPIQTIFFLGTSKKKLCIFLDYLVGKSKRLTALAVNGEALNSATATVTPAAVENYFNVYVSAIVEVPRGCCVTVAAKNTSAEAVSFANSNLTIDRVS